MAQRLVLALVVAATLVTSAAMRADRPANAAAGSGIDVQVLGLGKPIAGVVVRTKVKGNESMESWMPGTKALAEDSTDASGHVHFAGLAPGRYIVALACDRLGEDWIGGNAISLVEVFEGRTSRATLSLRRGGHVIGKLVGDPEIVRTAEIGMVAPEAMMSGCATVSPAPIRPDGSFEVRKVPVGSPASISATVRVGEGQVQVWNDVKFDKPDSVQLTLRLPDLSPENLGRASLTIRNDDGRPVHKGSLDVRLARGTKPFSYRLQADLPDQDSVLVVGSLPAGVYTVRPSPDPGSFPWWYGKEDTVVIEPKKTTRRTLQVRLQRNQ